MDNIVQEVNIPIGQPIDLVALAVKKSAIRCRVVSTQQLITFRKVRFEVEGEILTIMPSRVWRYGKTHYMAGDIISTKIDIPGLNLQPLALYEMGTWDPETDYFDEGDDPLHRYFQEIIDSGPRQSYEMEQIIPFQDPEDFDSDPIIEAADSFESGNRENAIKIMEKILTAELRCIDAHAHLGNWEFNSTKEFYKTFINRAKKHFKVGFNIGELSLGKDFNGLLPWGCIDNRPFLRCMHGYGLSLWRLGQTEDARKIFQRMLWLNPNDNQGIRFLLESIDDGKDWNDMD
ncbi:MAG: hypothetical protein QNK40_09685 [Desulfobacterales bacterium]|nr:hypothetical protein [Desulfobacterales bacterium]